MLRLFFILAFCIGFGSSALAQDKGFFTKLRSLPADVRKSYLEEQVPVLYKADTAKARRTVKECIQQSGNDKELLYWIVRYAAGEEIKQKNLPLALDDIKQAVDLSIGLKDEEAETDAVRLYAKILILLNRENEAIELLLKTLKKAEGHTGQEAILLSQIGVTFKEIQKDDKALSYLKSSNSKLKGLKDLNEKMVHVQIDNDKNIGVLYRNKKEYDTALFYFNKSMALAESIGDKNGVATNLNSLGSLYQHTKEYPKAIDCYERSIKIKEGLDNKSGIGNTLGNLGELYITTGNYKKAEECFLRCLELLKNSNDKKRGAAPYVGLYRLYDKMNQPLKGYPYLKQAYEMKEEIYNEDIAAESAKLEAIYENEKKNKEIELGNLKNEELKNTLELKNRQRNILLAGASALLILLLLAVWSYAGKRKANRTLEEKNKEVLFQKTLVEHQNKEILDSINYARKIQSAIIPSPADFNRELGDSFVHFRPKDIVSGDFYWMSRQGDHLFYATVDCTGHGVPGGFMSVLAASLLNEIVNEKHILEPSCILDELRNKVIGSLRQKGEGAESKDGMDMSLCRLNAQRTEVTIAAANNPVWIVKDKNLQVVEADKFPVGISVGEVRPFTQKTIALAKGDVIYTFTDGYADQFGGPKGKKFKYRQLQEKLLAASHLPMNEQHDQLEKAFNEWQGKLEQVDDVCVIGVRV